MKQQRKKGHSHLRMHVADLLPVGETVVLYGERRMTVQGCRRILSYSPELIRLQLKKRTLAIRGAFLECVSFSGGCTTLQGRIKSVESEGGEG